MALALNNLKRADMPLSKETKPKLPSLTINPCNEMNIETKLFKKEKSTKKKKSIDMIQSGWDKNLRQFFYQRN